ncbi:hypothetical protein [uncultured Methylophaga sp.]|uniref:gp53-like domain-containing protein n=1 Tax=uncultured Methylophaga sp. TaxID=285271 RepID=UPI0030F69603
MAIKLAERYPTRASDPSLAYPTGSFKNKSAPGAVDGTPLEKDWANDFLGFRDALLDAAEIVANGDIDTAQASQTFDALTAYIAASSPQTPSQTQAVWNAGESTVESKISSLKLQSKVLNMFGGTVDENDYTVLPNGMIIQIGNTLGSSTAAPISFPISFPNNCFIVMLTDHSTTNASTAAIAWDYESRSLSNYRYREGGAAGNHSFLAIGN